MRITATRILPDGTIVIDADDGRQRTFADRQALLDWSRGERDDGWEALQAYIVQEVEINPAWNAIENLHDATVTAVVTVTVTRNIT